MSREAWPAARHREVPGIIGKRALLCAFSAVTPLLPKAGLRLPQGLPFRTICVEACMNAAPAQADADVRALVRDLPGIAAGVFDGLEEHPEGDEAWDWLHASDGGMGGGDPRGFWADAVRWAGRTKPEAEDADLQEAILDFCVPAYDAMTDPAWGAAIDEALKAPYDDADIAVSARQGFGLLDGAVAGGDINVIAITLTPMRNWSILTGRWQAASDRIRAGLSRLGAFYWADRTALGWAEGSRINDAWLDAPAHQAGKVLGHADA